MAEKNRVIWNEGLFIRPHHFQQEAKYVEYIVDQKTSHVSEFLFGFQSLELDQEYLSFGKLGIQRASGSMPDGTVFNIPEEAPPPAPLTISETSMINQVVYLCLPLKSNGVLEVNPSDSLGQSRYVQNEIEIKDTFSQGGDYGAVDVAKVNLRLMLESEDRSNYSCIAVARIIDKQTDNSIAIDQAFYPASLSLNAIPQLKQFLEEIAYLMQERSRNIASRVGSPSQAGVADVTDFMMLITLNRLYPYLMHLSRIKHVHPENLYASLISACGELSTFIGEKKMPDEFFPYDHASPHSSFIPLENNLRKMLGTVMQAKAIPIPVTPQKFGIYSAAINEKSLISSADFILAVRASAATETIRARFTQQTKISSLEKINELINLQLPGIPLIPLPVAPRHLPYHAGFTYFQLDKNDVSWNMMNNASGFGFHLAGEYQDLEMEFWAIRVNE
jgi:type VI secretion system protein ImpJ